MMMRRTRRTFLLVGLAFVGLLAFATAPGAQGPSGKIEVSSTSIAAGIGVTWGDGTVTLNDGRQLKLKVEGLDVGAVGISSVKAVGTVYNLKQAADISGNYVLGQAGIAVGGGPGVLTMQNQNGVVINLQSVDQGIALKLGSGGMKISVKN